MSSNEGDSNAKDVVNDNHDNDNDNDNDDNMTLEEREDWLRSRGVEIETPGDRRAPRGPSVVDQLTALSLNRKHQEEEEEGSVPFVFVPADVSKALQTLHLPPTVAKESPGDALPKYVQAYFASDRTTIDASLLKDQATKHFAGGDLQTLAESKLSPAAMNAVAAQGSVETFPLVHPADTNQFQGVYIYLDEVGMLKKLTLNTRASKIAQACGYNPAPNFYGDVFMGRVQTKPRMVNIGFVAGVDTDRGATWMQRAISENLAWQQDMNQVTGKVGQTQPDQIGTEGKAAVEDEFEWTQDENELEIVVPSRAAAATATATNVWDKKHVKISFLPRSVKVKSMGDDKISIPLYGAIDVDGCTWTIDDGGKKLIITCEKANSGELWPRIKS